ncbi:hypothetical protein FRC03_010301 [Tulasnella sp. 419]|nr:hypothetical protein FRC03_010301 [Tulasnella sp. 419]
MLSLPSRHAASHKTATATAATEDPNGDHVGTSAGFWGYLTPKRSHALVSRESNVALREAEVARREAELLAGYPAGVPVCPPCVLEEEITPSMSLVARAAPPPPAPAVPAPATTTVVEVETAGPAWLKERMDAIVDRELKISQREKDVGLREEAIGKRESDATKREAWIMEQLLHLQPPEPIEEEIIYEPEHPRHYYGEARRASPPKVGTKPPPRHQ